VLDFSFAVLSPLSAAVAYAQTASDSLQATEPPTETTTSDQGSGKVSPAASDLNFTPTGEPGPMVIPAADPGFDSQPITKDASQPASDVMPSDQAPSVDTPVSPDTTKTKTSSMLLTPSGTPEDVPTWNKQLPIFAKGRRALKR
jgi:hypothetical protein